MKISQDLIKNDVPADGQIKDGNNLYFNHICGANLKILFLGNSITRHGRAEELGWYGDWGMAASSAENDYVHRLLSLFKEDGKTVSYCVTNLSGWERNPSLTLLETDYSSAREFKADIIVVRLGENALLAERCESFKPHYAQMVKYFSSCGAKVILTDLFWEYEPFDGFVKELALREGYAFARLHDLGRSDEMKAIGKFAHEGVAAHPGDKGMEEIARRIYRAYCQI